MARRRSILVILLTLALAAVIGSAASQPGRAAGTRDCPKPSGRPVTAAELIPALRRLVPKHYGDMTNQSGRGAWRGYDVAAEFWLGWHNSRGRIYPQLYRRSALRACGARVADSSWVVIIEFPRSQTAVYGTSAAYITRAARGLVIWRDQIVHP